MRFSWQRQRRTRIEPPGWPAGRTLRPCPASLGERCGSSRAGNRPARPAPSGAPSAKAPDRHPSEVVRRHVVVSYNCHCRTQKLPDFPASAARYPVSVPSAFPLSGLAIWPEFSGIASVGWPRRKTQRVELPHARCVDQTGCMHASRRSMNCCEDAATAFRLDLRCHRPPLSLLRPKSAVSPRKPP